jgi:endonuclease YncB( thermonuclease family)
MKRAFMLQFVLMILGVVCLAATARAATLQAKVTEVESGNRLVVSNISRSLRVRLKGVAPPEMGQPFSDAAREHLKALILNKAVTVEYTNLSEGYLDSRVFLNEIDIGSQMIRDGVAWYDPTIITGLSVADQSIYQQCEQAARSEKRGLWADQNPVSPWEFRKAQLAKQQSAAAPAPASLKPPKPRASAQVLKNNDFFGSAFGGGSAAGAPSVHPVSENGSADRWIRLESAQEHYSILVPSNSVEGTFGDSSSKEGPAFFRFITGGSPEAFCVFVSAKGPLIPQTEAEIADYTMKQMIAGMNEAASAHYEYDRILSIKSSRPVKVEGLSGKQYVLHSDAISGTARVLTRKFGEAQEVFVIFALTRSGSESLGVRLLSSFKLK